MNFDEWFTGLSIDRGTFNKRFFHRNSNSMEISFCSNPGWDKAIALKFCTWHDSCTVVACAKFCSNIAPYNGVTLKSIFHRIWITWKSFVKWDPFLQILQCPIPQCTSLEQKCTHLISEVMHYGIWDRCILGFVSLVYLFVGKDKPSIVNYTNDLYFLIVITWIYKEHTTFYRESAT